ncbi:MAG: TonB-dependent receptor [candidate division Zixibacteria bacterium]|nr:TonB-dependent receptor [candidate division Zixibacteria bacterium]
MNKTIRLCGIATLVVLALGHICWAGTTGKIAGVITDSATNQPIIGATISVVGTSWGTLSDEQGRFTLLNLPVGAYALKAAIIGYGQIEVKNVAVSVDLTTAQSFSLSSRAVEMGPVTVTVERPMVLHDQTSSLRIISVDQIKNLPTRGYQEIVGLQSGVVRFSDNVGVRARGARENSTTGSLNLRGGRPSEVAYYVDGFSQQDPLTGLSTTQINNNSIEEVEVITGGFNAEYGLIMSGAVNVTTKEGTSAYHGTLESVTDKFHGDTYDYNVYSGVLSGPVIPGSDKLTFYGAGEHRWAGDRDPHATANGILPNNTSGLWNWQGKLNWRPAGNIAARIGTNGSVERWREYRHDYIYDAAHMPRYEDKNYSVFGEFTHTLNPKTFYSLKGNWFDTERKRGDGVYFDNVWGYGRPSGNPKFDAEQLFWAWDDMNLDPDSLAVPREDGGPKYYPLHTAVSETTLTVDLPDGSTVNRTFVAKGDEGSVWDDYLRHQSSYIGGKVDLVSQATPHHELKLGADFQRHTLRRYEDLFPTYIYQGYSGGGFKDINYYGFNQLGEPTSESGLNGAKHPVNFAAYLQDKFESEGLVLNAGVRLDYFDYRTERLIDPKNPLDPFNYQGLVHDSINLPPNVKDSLLVEAGRLTAADLTKSKAVARLSPRLGVAFPVADGSVFHFSYGKFLQRPDLQNLYVNYGYLEYKIKTGGYFYPFGNPNLEPEETTAYEAGWRRQVSNVTAVDVTTFYKDIKNLTQVMTQPTLPNSFSSYRNRDFGTVKGIEFQLDMRRSRGISAQFNYTLSYADGTGSFANTDQNIAWTLREPPKNTSVLEFDQRHKVTGIFDVRAGAKEGPKLGSWFPLERSGANFVLSAGSGFPYSPVRVYNEVTLGNISPVPDGPINSRTAPWTMRVDLKADREIPISDFTLDVYLWVINVLDRVNVSDVYESSGLPDLTGWLDTKPGQDAVSSHPEPHDTSVLNATQKYEVRQSDPRNFDTPRQIRFGVRWSF